MRRLVVLVGTLTLVVFVAAGLLPAATGTLVGDTAQLVVSGVVTWLCLWTSRKQVGIDRSWRLLAAMGMGGWTAGILLLASNRNLGGRVLPMPSLADYAILLFHVLLIIAVLRFVKESHRAVGGSSERHTRVVSLLDSLIVVGSLFTLTWSTALGWSVRNRESSTSEFLVSAAYPIASFVLVAIVVLVVVTRRVHDRFAAQLWLLGTGLTAIAASCGAHAYLDTTVPTHAIAFDVGFVVGPVLIGVAALTTSDSAATTLVPRVRTFIDRGHLLMPYGFALLTGAVVLGRALGGGGMDVLGTSMVWLVVVLVLIRQIVILLENKVLLEQLSSAQSELSYRAHHDPLTGLANRTLLGLRLSEAMDHRRRSGQTFAVLLIDLDDFKSVNDTLGHAAGDLLLQIVGDRLRGCVRANDTVSRLGGDEFVVVLASNNTDPWTVAQRIVAFLAEPCVVDGQVLTVKACVGIVEPGYEPGLTPEVILHRADGAMYAGKRRGKSVIVAYDATGRSTLTDDTDIILN